MIVALFIVAVCVAGVWALHLVVPTDEWDPWPADDDCDGDFAARLDEYIAWRELDRD